MPYLFVLSAVFLRLLPHAWNLTPLSAMFLFSGATFPRKRESLLVPFAALLLSDAAVMYILYGGRYGWNSSLYTWTGFLLIGVIGWSLRGRISAGRVAGASLAGSVLFFVVTNFGVWMGGAMYPATLSGLASCYVAALPFFRNAVLGDLAYAALFFGCWQWLQHRRPALAPAAK
jgi:Family of unknown function (DUF6580)